MLETNFLGSFEVGWSGISGPVVDAEFGLFISQRKSMGLDFHESGSALFANENCPAFVSCYESHNSGIFSTEIRTVSDSMFIGSLAQERREFRIANPIEDFSLFRDVAGTIGISPNSQFFKNRILNVTASERGLKVDVFKSVGRLPETVQWIRSDSDFVWVFQSRISVNDVQLGGDSSSGIILGPRIDGLVFPRRIFDDFLRLLTGGGIPFSKENKKVKFPCNLELSAVRIQLNFSEKQMLTISLKNLIKLHSKSEEIGQFCKAHIDVWNSPQIVVGKALFSSSKFVIFNFVTKSMAFSPNPDWTVGEPYPLVTSQIPLFSLPVFSDQFVVFNSAAGGSLLLRSAQPMNAVNAEGAMESCWSFYRLKRERETIPKTSRFQGKLSQVKISEQRIRFRVIPDELQSFTIHESDADGFYRICFEKDLSGFDLPDSVMAEDPCSIYCAICRDTVQRGQRVQHMRHCQHAFHEKCAIPWILNKPICPYCRTVVRGKPTGEPNKAIINCIVS